MNRLKILPYFFVFLAMASCAIADQLPVDGDTWVREDQPDDNRDGNAFMNARTDEDGDDNDVVLLRFDTSSLISASGSSLNLTWFRSDGSTGKTLSLYGINDGTADDTMWDETVVTYNTAPGLIPDGMDPTMELAAGHNDDDVHDLDIANLTLLVGDQDYGPQTEGAAYSFASSALDDFLNADTNGQVSLLITRNTDTSGNQARFITKEATEFNSGAMVPPGGAGAFLDGVTVPEPTTMGLLLIVAVVGGSLVRRRR